MRIYLWLQKKTLMARPWLRGGGKCLVVGPKMVVPISLTASLNEHMQSQQVWDKQVGPTAMSLRFWTMVRKAKCSLIGDSYGAIPRYENT